MELTVNSMSCGHCVQSITKAIQALDPKAVVSADLETHKVSVQTQLTETAVRAALSDIGFDAE